MNPMLDPKVVALNQQVMDIIDGADVEAVIILNHGGGCTIQEVAVRSPEMCEIADAVFALIGGFTGSSIEIKPTGETVQ